MEHWGRWNWCARPHCTAAAGETLSAIVAITTRLSDIADPTPNAETYRITTAAANTDNSIGEREIPRLHLHGSPLQPSLVTIVDQMYRSHSSPVSSLDSYNTTTWSTNHKFFQLENTVIPSPPKLLLHHLVTMLKFLLGRQPENQRTSGA